MKYIKGERIITASEKAYRTIYKSQGYVPYQENEPENEPDEADVPNEESVNEAAEVLEPKKELSEMNVTELKALAKEKGTEGYSSLTKSELLEVLKDVV